MSNEPAPKRARPLPRTPVALSVLSLLNERSMHPYEMRSLIRERGHDRAFRIKESSVYDIVARLADRGFIEPVEVSREGRRPERTVYAITEAGRDELIVWLWDLASEPSAEYPGLRRAADVHLLAWQGPCARRVHATHGQARGGHFRVRHVPPGVHGGDAGIPADLRDRGGVRAG
jgi:DNA-binding PadR family transcriptional regulator